VRVQDNGKGLDEQRDSPAARRFGLMGMRERVQALGGCLEISGGLRQGVLVKAVIPVTQPQLEPAALD